MNKIKPVLHMSKLAMVLACLWLPSAHASYIVDLKIGEALLANSSAASELAAIKSASGNSNLVLDVAANVKINPGNIGANDQWYINIDPAVTGYFLLKFDIGSTAATANTFFFENIGELSKLVWTNSQVQFLSGGDCTSGDDSSCNIGRLSHYAEFSAGGGGPVPVPEPASLALLGIGLLGLIGANLRKRTRSVARVAKSDPAQ